MLVFFLVPSWAALFKVYTLSLHDLIQSLIILLITFMLMDPKFVFLVIFFWVSDQRFGEYLHLEFPKYFKLKIPKRIHHHLLLSQFLSWVCSSNVGRSWFCLLPLINYQVLFLLPLKYLTHMIFHCNSCCNSDPIFLALDYITFLLFFPVAS